MLEAWETGAEAERARALIDEMERVRGAKCPDCGRAPCGHEYIVNVVLGTRNEPRCAGCLSQALGRERHELLEQAREYVAARECFRKAWNEAGRDEGYGAAQRPACLWPEQPSDSEAPRAVEPRIPLTSGALSSDEVDEAALEPVASWDAGEMSCGDLLLELRTRMARLSPGDLFELTALDPSARRDLPAWCRLTGENLVRARHPLYWIQRRGDARCDGSS